MGRREVLALFGAVGGIALVGCGGGATSDASAIAAPDAPFACVATPEETEGPYFVDERLDRSDLTVDTTNPAVTRGIPLELRLSLIAVKGSACTPLSGAQVDVWHADASGVYSDESAQDTAGQTFLRGYQITDQNGVVAFKSIYPGSYPGRTVHVHFKVRTSLASNAGTSEHTSQLFFDDAVTDAVFRGAEAYGSGGRPRTTNAMDAIYRTSGERLMLALEPLRSGSGYVGTFRIGLRVG
jgi:protocatechuate 3,4-dioxygenase beta subunit